MKYKEVKMPVSKFLGTKKFFSGERLGFKVVKDGFMVLCGSYRVYGAKSFSHFCQIMTLDTFSPMATIGVEKSAIVSVLTPIEEETPQDADAETGGEDGESGEEPETPTPLVTATSESPTEETGKDKDKPAATLDVLKGSSGKK